MKLTNDKRGVTQERRLLIALVLFFIALAVPSALLGWRAYEQSRWEVFHGYRLQAEALVTRIDATLSAAVAVEDARGFTDYTYGAGYADGLSPLAGFPPSAAIAGTVGYFQVDSSGTLSSPMLPEGATGVVIDSLDARRERVATLRALLAGERSGEEAAPARRQALPEESAADADVVASAPEPAAAYAEGNLFDRLASVTAGSKRERGASDYGNVADLRLDRRLEQKSALELRAAAAPPVPAVVAKRKSRKEQVAVVERELSFDDMAAGAASADAATVAAPRADAPQMRAEGDYALAHPAPVSPPRVRLFESDVDPMNLRRLDEHHLVMFRNVWREGERYVQGLVIDEGEFLRTVVTAAWQRSALVGVTHLLLAWQGDVVALESGAADGVADSAGGLRGELLYRARLSAPLSAVELVFSVRQLPLGAGAAYLGWVMVAFLVVLAGGSVAMYRFGRGQLRLFRQQQDFVSAVSHELKTPLTSIRMYSEMLLAGWADEARKTDYYTYIHDESERLSRLINNVLQLARINRGQTPVSVQAVGVRELLDVVRSKLDTQLRQAGFDLEFTFDPGLATAYVEADEDAVIQILINLLDNAIKFTPSDARKAIELRCEQVDDGVRISVRDFGHGVDRAQMRRIFELFYRVENELTRDTVGTGIGLALVHQLARAMNAAVDVSNRDPGAEFSLTLAFARTDAHSG